MSTDAFAALDSFDIVAESIRIINENSDVIIQLVRGQMAVKGKNGSGKQIQAKYGESYTSETIYQKTNFGSGLGKETSHVTMFQSGSFYSLLRLETSGDKFQLFSDVEQFEILNDLWNDGTLVELDIENLEYFRDTILAPQLAERLQQHLQNGI